MSGGEARWWKWKWKGKVKRKKKSEGTLESDFPVVERNKDIQIHGFFVAPNQIVSIDRGFDGSLSSAHDDC